MQSFYKTVVSNAIIQAILFIILGVLCLAWPGITILTILYMMAFLFAISGGIEFVQYFRDGSAVKGSPATLAYAICLVLVAFIIFILPGFSAEVFTICVGIVIVLCGFANLAGSFGLRVLGGAPWIVGMLISVLVIIGGFALIMNPFEGTALFVQVLGWVLIINGIADLLIAFWGRSLN